MTFSDLRNALQGQLWTPSDADFEAAAQPWNLTVSQPVAAVAEVASAADVATAVNYARRAGLTIAAQPTGHGATGGLEDAILLRTGRLNTVAIDPAQRTARVGAGANWGAVQTAAAAHGLTGLAGSNPVVGVTGYTLGGGLSWFSRKYGWASNAVQAFDIVGADGQQAHVTADTDPDLFWALCGGGGDFAIVTALEFRLFPAPGLYGGRVAWPGERAPEVFELFTQITAQAPNELSVWFDRAQFPGAPPLAALNAAYLGDPAQGQALLAALDSIGGAISDTRAPMAIPDLGTITSEPTNPSPSLSRGELLPHLSSAAIRKTVIDDPVAPLMGVQVRHLGGALAGPAAGARGPVSEPYLLYLLGLGIPPHADAVRARRSEIGAALAGEVSGMKPYTFLSPGETAADTFDPGTLDRLRAIKTARDPQTVIRGSYPVLG